jgi:hypothetical protein
MFDKELSYDVVEILTKFNEKLAALAEELLLKLPPADVGSST